MLNYYRTKSSFSSRKLKEYIETNEVTLIKEKLYQLLENDPVFHKSPTTLSLDETRKMAVLRGMRLLDSGILQDPAIQTNPLLMPELFIAIVQYDSDTFIKSSFSTGFFGNSIKGLGTEEHHQLLNDAISGKITGCFALTEVAHGSDAKKMRTTATFDKNTQEFILHTEDFEAAKCWSGNLGQFATHATVFAQLITPDGQNHGLHAFVVPIRDLATHEPFPGLIIGDMGEKIGLNGIDNGFCMFDQYRVPKQCLLSRIGNITEDGEYVSPIKDPRKRFGAALGTLIGGRLGVCSMALAYAISAVCIAVRYSAARRQFGPDDHTELSVIEYQLQQYRLFPHLASVFAMKAFTRSVNTKYFELAKSFDDTSSMLSKAEELLEMHILMSAAKPVCSWAAAAAIQDCREGCGGHGYLKCAGLGDLRNNNDSNCTYEGENNVLQQQAGNWLLRLWRRQSTDKFSSPLGSVTFLYEPAPHKMAAITQSDLCHPPVLMETYQWLVCWLVAKATETYNSHLQQGMDSFTARNHSQVYDAKPLAIAYIEHYILKCFWDFCCAALDDNVKEVLTKLCALYGLTSLEKHLVFLYQGGYIEGPKHSQLMQAAILSLCEQLKFEAISLVDAIAPSDFILNSALGHSNGQVYKNLQQAFLRLPGCTNKPVWWRELSAKYRSRL